MLDDYPNSVLVLKFGPWYMDVNECQNTSHINKAHLMTEPADAMNRAEPKHDFGAYDAWRI